METTTRLTRGGLLAGLVAAGGAVVRSAPVVQPTVRPERVDLMVSVVGWWISVAMLGWLTVSLGTWIVVLGRPALEDSRVVRLVTAPGSRRLAEGLLTVGILAGCSPSASQVAAPQIEVLRPAASGAPTTAPAPTVVESSVVITVDRADPPPAPETTTFPEDAMSEVEETGGEDPIVEMTSHTVVRGDNLWRIAANHLATRFGRPATNSEISPYWVAVIGANTATIRSGDPDLIYPGEVLELPPVE